MIQSNKYIIGAGLNGLITAYYLKDYILIDKKENVGGQFNNKFPLGPRFIHYNKKFESLLKELRIKYEIKKAKIIYFYKGKLYKKLSPLMIKEYNLKTRNSKDDESFLCNKNNNFKYLDFNHKKFINKIFKKIENRFINNLVKKIDIKSKVIILNNDKELKFDKLISTIHYKDFCKLNNIKYKPKNKDIYFYCCKNKFKDMNVDFIYSIDKNDPVNRVSFNKNFMIIESIKIITLSNFEILDSCILKDYKLSNKNKVKKFKDVYFLGRYANLDNSKRINSIFEEIKNVK